MTRSLRNNFDLKWDYLKDTVPFATNIIICMNVIFAYLNFNTAEYCCTFILYEALLSKSMGASNVFGVMTSVYAETLERKAKKKEE